MVKIENLKRVFLSILLFATIYSCKSVNSQPNDILSKLVRMQSLKSITNLDIYLDSLGFKMDIPSSTDTTMLYYPKKKGRDDIYIVNKWLSKVGIITTDYDYYIEALKSAKSGGYKELSSVKEGNTITTVLTKDSVKLTLLKEIIDDKSSYSILFAGGNK